MSIGQAGQFLEKNELGLSAVHHKMRDYMERRVTPPRRFTSAPWGPPPPCTQALKWVVIIGKKVVPCRNRLGTVPKIWRALPILCKWGLIHANPPIIVLRDIHRPRMPAAHDGLSKAQG